VDGLKEYTTVTADILDENFVPIPGYSGPDDIPLSEPGFRRQITWKAHSSLSKFPHAVRIRINYGGVRPEDARVYAVYLKQ
jgi:hypothetical protein